MSDPISTPPPGIPRQTPRLTTIDDLLTEFPVGFEPPKSSAIDAYLKSKPSTPASGNAIDTYLKAKPSTPASGSAIDDYLKAKPSTPASGSAIDDYLKSKPNTPAPESTIDAYLKKPSTSTNRSVLDQYLATGMTPNNSSQSQLALRDKFITKLGLKPQADGSYLRDGDTSKYHLQPNGTFFRSAGEVTLPNGSKQQQAAATLSLDGDTIKETNDAILPWTTGITNLRLTLNSDGSYRRHGDNGRYLLQPDGTIFYEGSESAKPQTYDPTKPHGSRFDTSKDTPIPGALAAANIGLIPKTKDTFVLPAADGTLTLGEYTIKPNGDVHWSGGKDSTGRTFPPLIGRFDGSKVNWFAVVDSKEYPLQTAENPDKTTKYFIDDGTVKKTFNSTTGSWDNS